VGRRARDGRRKTEAVRHKTGRRRTQDVGRWMQDAGGGGHKTSAKVFRRCPEGAPKSPRSPFGQGPPPCRARVLVFLHCIAANIRHQNIMTKHHDQTYVCHRAFRILTRTAKALPGLLTPKLQQHDARKKLPRCSQHAPSKEDTSHVKIVSRAQDHAKTNPLLM